MITRRGFAGGMLLGVAVFGLGGCGADEREQTLKYKMTVTVETPQGIRGGNAVRALAFEERSGSFLGESQSQIKLAGEAVVVELPGGKTLFALLSGADGDVDYAGRIADRSGLWGGSNSGAGNDPLELWPTAPKTQKLERTSAYPMLVTFKDIKDPTSVVRVDPDNLAKSFGAGYRLKAITVQVTDEPVTVGIQRRLGWLDAVGRERSTLIPNPPKYLDEITDPVQRVNPGDFTTELYK